MIFNSLTFFYFFTALLIVNALLPLRFRNGWILVGGILFYMSWSPVYILLLLVTAAVDYIIAIRMAALPTKAERKPWLMASLVFSLGSLVFFKYTTMALGTAGDLSALLGLGWRPPHFDIALPLGISFYTFETVSYAVDVYRGDLQPKRSFFQYLSFLMFFPKLIAGPIVRASELLHQIPKDRLCSTAAFHEGLNLILLGFGKKVLLADNFAPFIEKVFAHPLEHNRWMNIVAVYGYSMQVYFDFSAYSDIARGCAKWMGYELPQNFNKPYLATSISDFWRRWHMTLSRWLRDYFYIPMGGNSGGKLLTYRNLFLTMLVGGLWHGANWTFVAWGALNGSFLVAEKVWHDMRGMKVKRTDEMSFPEALFRGFIVFNLITFTRIFFRSPDFKTAMDVMGAIARPAVHTADIHPGLVLIPLATVAYLLASPLHRRLMAWQPTAGRAMAYGAAAALMVYFGASNAEFIYFQF